MVGSPTGSGRIGLLLVLVVVLVASAAGTGVATGAYGGAPSAADGPSVGSGAPGPAATTAVSGDADESVDSDCETNPPDDIPRRQAVEDTTTFPHSAIGHVRTPQGNGTGFMVSDYHMVTAAHVATDSDGGDPLDDIEFVPGYDDPPNGEATERFGTAQADKSDVTVPEKWNGGWNGWGPEMFEPEGDLTSIQNYIQSLKSGTLPGPGYFDDVVDLRNDMALVRLDRPVGTATGHFEFDQYDSGVDLDDPTNPSSAYWESFDQAGYSCEAEGTRMLTADVEGWGTQASIHIFKPTNLAPGDSGSPIWHKNGGERVVASVATTPFAAARFSDRRYSLFESQILNDERPESSPELDVLGQRDLATDDHPDWVQDRSSTPDSVVYHGQEVSLSATLYNEGYDSSIPDDQPGPHDTFPYHERPEVEFFVATDEDAPQDSRLGSVCSASDVPGPYNETEVSCSGTLEALYDVNVESVDEFHFFARVNDSDVADDHRPRLVGSASNDAESAGPPALDAVDAARAADRPGYAREHFATPETVEDPSETVQLATTVYNEGLSDVPQQDTGPIPTDAYAEVEFYVSDVAPYGDFEVDPSEATLVCSDRVWVESLDDATSSCTGSLGDAVLADRANFYAYVDHSTAASDHEPRFVGSAEISPGSDPSLQVEEVDAPDRVGRNGEYDVTATVASDADLEPVEAPVQATASQGSCTAASDAVTVRPEEQSTVAVDCTAPSDPGSDPVTVEVAIGTATATAEVTATEIDYTADVQLEPTDYELHGVPDPEVNAVEVGDQYGLSATVENVGSEAGTRRLFFKSSAECSNLDPDSVAPRHEILPDVRVVDLAPGESTEVHFFCDLPLGGWVREHQRSADVMVHEIDDDTDSYSSVFPDVHELNDFDLIERETPPNVQVDGVDAPGTATAGAPIEVDPNVVNEGGPGNASARLLVDGEVVDERQTYLNRYEAFPYLSFEYVPGPGDVGEQTLTVETGDDSGTTTVDVEPAPVSVAIGDAPETVASSQETVAVDATVSNDGDGAVTRSVSLVVNGTHVDAAEVTVDAGSTSQVALEGTVPDHVDEAVAVRVETPGDADETVLDVVPPETVVEIVDAPETTNPNGSFLVDANVTNEGEHPASVQPRILVDDREGTWLDALELEPGQTETVRLWNAVPENATAGDDLDVRVETKTGTDATTVAVDARRAWTQSGPNGTVASGSTIANGTVFTQTSDAVLAADAETGEERWTREAARGGVGTAPTVAGGSVFAGGESVQAFDATSGDLEWTFEPNGSAAATSPTVSGDTVYVAAGRLYALDAATGETQWSYNQSAARFASSPTVAGDAVYVGSVNGSLLAVDAATGDELWSFDAPADSVRSAPTVGDVSADSSEGADGETVFVGSHDETLYAVNATTGEPVWQYDAPEDDVQSSPTYVEGADASAGTVLVGSRDGTLHAVDAGTGAAKWTFSAGGTVGTSSPTVAGETVYLGASGLYAVDLATGELAWSFGAARAAHSSPTVADGTVYVGTADRGASLYAVDADHDASSVGSRVALGTLGHVGPRESGTEPKQDGPTCTTVDGQTVCDVNGDGHYRDVDGNEDVGHADVQAFFSVQHRPTWKQPDLFDFNGNEAVGHGDVVALFEHVATGSL